MFDQSRITAAAVAAVLACGTMARAAAFTNGSFETSTSVSPGPGTATGWVVAGHTDFNSNEGRTDGTTAAIFNDGQSTATGVLSQAFDTITGQTYSVQFDYGNFGASVHQQVQAEVRNGTSPTGGAELINSGSGTISTTTGGSIVTNTSLFQVKDDTGTGAVNTAAPNTEFSALSFTFTAQSASSTLVFTDQGNGGADATDGILDNVRVTATTPEPASVGLLGVGALGLLARRRTA